MTCADDLSAPARLGFEAECARIQSLYLDGHKREAAAAVPLAMVESVALIGPRSKVAAELDAWRSSLVTTMLVAADSRHLRTIAELVLG
jgi:hypothetical protein